MENRKIAVLQFNETSYGHIEENADGELAINVTAIPIGWTGVMRIKMIARPRGAQAEKLFSEMLP